jgi:hypothetical protein
MMHSLPKFDAILFTHLKPSRTSDKPEAWFKSELQKMVLERHHYRFTFEVAFMRPLTPRSQYYRQVIDNDCIKFYNEMCSALMNAGNHAEGVYLLWSALEKTLKSKLQETGSEMAAAELNAEIFKSGPGTDPHQKAHWELAYILFYMLLSLMALYLNLQRKYPQLLNGGELSLNDLSLMYANGLFKPSEYLQEAGEMVQPMERKLPVEKEPHIMAVIPGKAAKPEQDEFDPIVKIAQLQQVEANLREYGILDADGQFVENRAESHRRKLAGVYKIMIALKYFRPYDPISRKKIKPNDLRLFLDQRYGVDLKETFRKITSKHIEEIKISLPWLDHLK